MSTATTIAAPTSYAGDRDHSSFAFAVRHMGISTFRGSFGDVDAAVRVTGDGALVVSGSAAVASISVQSPIELRDHLLSADFFDAERHPRLSFAGDPVRPAEDGSITVTGELAIRGIARPIAATGSWSAPVEDPFGGTRAALELTAKLDRRDYGMTWNLPLPKGGDALGHEVVLTVHLELIADER